MDENNIKIRKNCLISRVGETKISTRGEKITVINYINTHDCDIEFENGYVLRHVDYKQFNNGTAINPYTPTVYGKAYLGDGEYKAYINSHSTPQYRTWKNILKRCFNEKFKKEYKTYENCTICNEWLNFQNFAKWYDENFYYVEDEQMEVDKDILFKHNKEYSPDKCIFVPKRINSLFIKNERTRGQYKIGVFSKEIKGYRYYWAECNIDTKQVTIRCDNEEEAFLIYKKYKEQEIKKIAKLYKDKIPEKLYNALINYQVSEDD